MAVNAHHRYVSTDDDHHILIHASPDFSKGYRISSAESYFAFRESIVPRLDRIDLHVNALMVAWGVLVFVALAAGSAFPFYAQTLFVVWNLILLAPWIIPVWTRLTQRTICRELVAGLDQAESETIHMATIVNAALRHPRATLVGCLALAIIPTFACARLLLRQPSFGPVIELPLTTGETIRLFNLGYVDWIMAIYGLTSAMFGVYFCHRVIKVVRAERQITIA